MNSEMHDACSNHSLSLSFALFRSSVNFIMDNSIILVLSQALLYLKDPRVEQANKQLLKRKLASELVSDTVFFCILLVTLANIYVAAHLETVDGL